MQDDNPYLCRFYKWIERDKERVRERKWEMIVKNANINICHKVKHQNAMQ